LKPSTATEAPLTVVYQGAYASVALAPAPKTGYCAAFAAASVSASPTWP
jgi:hypothetical protein